MAVTFDAQAGITGSNLTGSPVGQTYAHSAALGADIYVSIGVSNGSPTSVQYNGTSLTLLSSVTVAAGSTGSVSLYSGAGLGTGSSKNVTFSCPATAWLVASSVSYTGVGSVGTAVTTSGASSLTVSTGSVSCTTGQLALAVLFSGMSNSDSLSSLSGGTNRSLQASPTNANVGMAISDASSTTTFTATAGNTGATGKWATIAVVLSPSSGLTPASATVAITRSTPSIGLTVAPAGATVTVSAGTPSLVIANPSTYFPTTASVAVTAGTPVVTVPLFLSPASASVSISGGTPTTAMSYGPLARVVNNLALGQSTTIQIIGDSTAFSAWDTGFSEATNPWTPGALFGWAGRMAISLGNYYNANVQIRFWNYPSNSAYTSTTNLRTAAGRPTISVWLGAWPGGVMSNYITSITSMLPVPNPDVVFIHDGFNELSASTFGTNLLSFIGSVQGTYCPGAPIIVNTQNATTTTSESGHPSFSSIFTALVNDLLSAHPALPLKPALQYSDSVSGVWALDTQQAYDPAILASQLFTDGLHPVASGYAAQALWMLSQLAPAVVTTLSPTTATVTLTASTPTVFNGVTTVVTPTGATMTVTAGAASTSLTGHVLTQPTGSFVTVTAGVAVVLGAGLHVSPATAPVAVLRGVPVVAISFPEIRTPTSRTLVAESRFRTRGVLR